MRIVGGRHRGRKLSAPKGQRLRPSAERVREALFDILIHRPLSDRPLEGAAVLDVFAGSGALGLEALSRGAARVMAIENDPASLAALRANAARLGESERLAVLASDATRLPRAREAFDLALLDAPYGSGLTGPALRALSLGGWLKAGALAVAELARSEPFDPPEGFTVLDERRYGAARLVFLRFEPPRHKEHQGEF